MLLSYAQSAALQNSISDETVVFRQKYANIMKIKNVYRLSSLPPSLPVFAHSLSLYLDF